MPSLCGYEPRIANFFGAESTPLRDAIEYARDQWPLFQLHLICESPSYLLNLCRQQFAEWEWVEVDGAFQSKNSEDSNQIRVHVSSSNKPISASPSVKNCMIAFFERDDVISYMLHWDPKSCASVLNRLCDEHLFRIGNDIELWTLLLQRMSQNDQSTDENLWQMLISQFSESSTDHTEGMNLERLNDWASACLFEYNSLVKEDDGTLFKRLYRLPSNLARIGEELLVSELSQFRPKCLKYAHFFQSIEHAGRRLRGNARIVKFVQKHLRRETASVAASLLNVMSRDWHPKRLTKLDLNRSYLEGVSWANIRQKAMEYCYCHFNFADFTGTRMKCVCWHNCQLNSASFQGSTGVQIAFRRNHVSHACMDGSQWRTVSLYRSYFRSSSWKNCKMRLVVANRVDFRESNLQQSVWQDCKFVQCNFNECNLSDIEASHSTFQGCAFIDCNWHNAKIQYSNLDEIQLEDAQLCGVRMEQSSLENANFTGSTAKNLVLCKAALGHARLADIVWSNCDLRSADLRGVHFHFGSTRCGTVDSPYPSHGTRTGFYTDAMEELYFKEPESVRRAALLDCDLRGANLDGVDFYLVDLRGTKLDPWQRRQASATGAILSD